MLQEGPHVRALTAENLQLIRKDLVNQQQAGFVRVVSESNLFGGETPSDLEISRVAVIP
jgi:hypothetical protein